MFGKPMRVLVVLAVAALLGPLSGPAAEAGTNSHRKVHRYQEGRQRLKITKANGEQVKKKLDAEVKVKLVKRNGKKRQGDLNDLSRGARVLKMRDRDGDADVDVVKLRQKKTQSSDCSFDGSDEDSKVASSRDLSLDCSLRYATDRIEEDRDCSYDQDASEESEGDEIDRDKSVSWDCSYEREGPGNAISWDCSFDASESLSSGPEGGDSDGDASFDCSWESEDPLDAHLWACEFSPHLGGFTCESERLGQSFGYAFEADLTGFGAFVAFSEDVVEDDEDEGEDVTCSGGGGSFECDFEPDTEEGITDAGVCEGDLSFDEEQEDDGGDLSGDLSFSCAWGDSL